MENLRKLRLAKGVSQQVVADYLEITRQAYSNYESGSREPDNETLLKLAEYFNISVDTLLRGHTIDAASTQADKSSMMAAFWGGEKDLSQEDLDDMWNDVERFAAFLAEKKRQEKKDG